ncbi:MAG: cell division protein ZapD [Gammaproteobacteria bacterium]|nr:cell division protein ZapD [Gammaproteobacteria bacterium]NIM73695.1 cell division protein ZapD [Gammaproteobacteria bacterium]NIN37369.1 cell division protein ZapD [Gammaproteobacteria bacterium]NIO25528.1 cell division protein ZapD [Gammaproteobacteria bacterium]NIO66203.1 cell division protein ZapD [Gammaproteobacteria bacterium]
MPHSRCIYEQPLSERIRTFLRLEHLFAKAEHALSGGDPWSSRATLEAIIDIMEVLSRADLKKEIIKELERHATTLQGLARNPNVDPARLEEVLNTVKGQLTSLRGDENSWGQELRDDELLSTVRQRSTITAGTCNFDLPALHYWLQAPAQRRADDLGRWLSSFGLLSSSVSLCLKLVRESAIATQEIAQSGFFQRTLETSTPCQMIRVCLPDDAPCYPEISAGKHRFTVRFMHLRATRDRPTQMAEDVAFDLHCCVI